MKHLLLAVLLCLSSISAPALELEGVKLDDKVHVENASLVLNGAGVRSRFFFDLYIAALYLPEKNSSGAAVLADAREKRMALHLLVSIGADHLFKGLSNAIAANHTPAELSALEVSLKEFATVFHAIGEMRKGDFITLDYLPGSGTQIGLNGAAKGMVGGVAFNSALLKVWLGDKPAQADLKQKLLGGQ